MTAAGKRCSSKTWSGFDIKIHFFLGINYVYRSLIADTDRQENLVPYRWHVALYPELAPLDDEINIGTGLRFTFRIFTLANAVGPNRQWFRDPMEG